MAAAKPDPAPFPLTPEELRYLPDWTETVTIGRTGVPVRAFRLTSNGPVEIPFTGEMLRGAVEGAGAAVTMRMLLELQDRDMPSLANYRLAKTGMGIFGGMAYLLAGLAAFPATSPFWLFAGACTCAVASLGMMAISEHLLVKAHAEGEAASRAKHPAEPVAPIDETGGGQHPVAAQSQWIGDVLVTGDAAQPQQHEADAGELQSAVTRSGSGGGRDAIPLMRDRPDGPVIHPIPPQTSQRD